MPFKDFQPAVLSSSDVNTYLMKQSVMVFDDASARTTALTSPVEGMMTYLKDTNTIWVYDGSAWQQIAGANNFAPVGYYKITPSSVSGTGTSIASNGDVIVTSGGTTFTVNGVFSSAFRNYRIHITDFEASSDMGMIMAFGTSFTGTAHNYSGLVSDTAGTLAHQGGANLASIDIGLVANSLYTSAGVLDIFNPFESNRETNLVGMAMDSRGGAVRYRGGHVRTTTSYTAFIMGSNTGATYTSCRLAIFGCG
jgi:hypothetical protein